MTWTGFFDADIWKRLVGAVDIKPNVVMARNVSALNLKVSFTLTDRRSSSRGLSAIAELLV